MDFLAKTLTMPPKIMINIKRLPNLTVMVLPINNFASAKVEWLKVALICLFALNRLQSSLGGIYKTVNWPRTAYYNLLTNAKARGPALSESEYKIYKSHDFKFDL